MIKIYQNGNDFYQENSDFLLTNKYTEVFFRFDAPLLEQTDKVEYALKAYDGKDALLILSKKPFNLLLYGSARLGEELVSCLVDNEFEIRDYLCPTDLGDALIASFAKAGYDFQPYIRMDFMECHVSNDADPSGVEAATEADLEEIYEMSCAFIKDCGLSDVVDKESLKKRIPEFRILRKDGKIVSMVKCCDGAEGAKKVSYVYTRDEYRGKGYGRKVVGTLVNEIIASGEYATLNVDQKNPISNRLYSSLGFTKIFSQGIYKLLPR